MDDVTAHALLLLLAPLASAALCPFFAKRRRAGDDVGAATLIAVCTGLAACVINQHLCSEGTPLTQWIVPATCLWCVLVFFESKTCRRVCAVLLVGIMFTLSCHYSDVVHEPEWTGNPRARSLAVRVSFESKCQAVGEKLLVLGDELSPSYEAGWLRDLPIARRLDEELAQRPFRESATTVWHTWFTRIYRREKTEQDYWYPGGLISEAAERIELRDR